jgi:hypothetical protein
VLAEQVVVAVEEVAITPLVTQAHKAEPAESVVFLFITKMREIKNA